MLIFAKLIKSIVTMLHSEISPKQIAGGFALGALIGLLPLLSLTNFLLVLLILLIQVNIGAAFLGAAVFGLFGFLLDPLSNQIGYLLLVNLRSLTPFWTWLYNLPLLPFTRFNNTLVMGSLAIGILIFIPLFIAAARFIVYYRANMKQKVEAMHFMKALKLTSIFQWYDRYKQ